MGQNTLTNLIPDFYVNLDVVSRELTGMIPSVTLDPSVARAAVGQQVRSFVAPAASSTDITPGVTPPDDGDQNIGEIPVTIEFAKRVPFRWNGEQSRGVNNGGPGTRNIQANQMQQAIRTLVNGIEAYLCGFHVNFSRAFGTPGTTPFASDLSMTAQLRKILVDNGAPTSDMSMVMDTTAGANLRTLANLTRVSEAGNDSLLRQGVLLDIHGAALRESGQIKTHTKGTAAGATTNAAGYAVGATAITLAAVGTGTVVAGDSIAFAGDPNKYLIASGDADVSNGGSITLAAPGLRKAIPAAATAITVENSSVRNMMFARSAIILATRAPALPDDGDSAVDRTVIQDPRTGLAFELSMYAQYRQMQYEVSIAYGGKVIKAEHGAVGHG